MENPSFAVRERTYSRSLATIGQNPATLKYRKAL
jgi:hypothetical protein